MGEASRGPEPFFKDGFHTIALSTSAYGVAALIGFYGRGFAAVRLGQLEHARLAQGPIVGLFDYRKGGHELIDVATNSQGLMRILLS